MILSWINYFACPVAEPGTAANEDDIPENFLLGFREWRYHSTVQTNQIEQLCNTIFDESTLKPKNLTGEEIVALGEKYQSLYPELDRQIVDSQSGYICLKFYVNKMEV